MTRISNLTIPPVIKIFLLLALYIFVGAFFDEIAAMVITLPFVVRLILHFRYDPVRRGIINVVVIRIGMIAAQSESI